MNLAAMLNDMRRKTKESTSSPNTDVTTRYTAFLNETQREVIGMKGFSHLRRNVLTFACVANSPFCSIPQALQRIVTVQDRTNMIVLQQVLIQDIRYDDPGLTQTTSWPYEYAVLDYASPIARDPSAAAAIYVKSDSASDGATITAYIEGIVTGGYYQTASVALNGTTAAQLGSLATWIAITKFYLSLTAGGVATATGNVTLTQTSGAGTELARIPPGGSYARYVRLHLYPTPSQANTYYADCELHINDLVQSGDEPYLPEDFHWVLVAGALEKEFSYQQRLDLAARENARYRNGLSDLRLYLVRTSGVAWNSGRPRRWSRLGGYFPVGS